VIILHRRQPRSRLPTEQLRVEINTTTHKQLPFVLTSKSPDCHPKEFQIFPRCTKDRFGRYVPRVEWGGAQEPSPRCVLVSLLLVSQGN
jgi:hypothetical protein